MEPLYIYKIGPVDHDYDEYDSFIIIASSEDEARQMALTESCGQVEFLQAYVEVLGVAQSHVGPRVVLGSFNAG